MELSRKNIWHAGHHKKMANFKSVAYVHSRCRSKYNTSINLYPAQSQYFSIEKITKYLGIKVNPEL